LHHVDVAHEERGFAIAEIIIPLTDEGLAETELFYFVDVFVELLTPMHKRSCVMQPDIFEVDEREVSAVINGFVDGGNRRQQRTREDMLLYPVNAAAQIFKA